MRRVIPGEERAMETVQSDLDILIQTAITPAAEEITAAFYDGMMKDSRAVRFLKSDLVDQRLRASMKGWICELVTSRTNTEYDAFRERQKQIGLVHARIGIPLHLVAKGVTILKREFCTRLANAISDRQMLIKALMHMHNQLDEATCLINESYVTQALSDERNDQTMRLQIVSHNMAIECERLRSKLFNWAREQLMALLRNEPLKLHNRSIRTSEIGLWISHKADLLFADSGETGPLKDQLGAIDRALEAAIVCHKEGREAELKLAVSTFDETVSEAAWLLDKLVERALEREKALDPMTHVLSRRFLPGVLQREVQLSLKGYVPFSVLMIDVDKFKKLNERYGHTVGDAALTTLSEVLLATLRANDFVFRYGGEEFLIVLGHIAAEGACAVAEKIRSYVESHRFHVEGHDDVKLTISIGVAVHDGHPDYKRIVDRADAALRNAKDRGRNRIALACD